MRKKIVLGLAVAISALSSFTVSAAAADARYPASNFEPSVIYIDKDVAVQAPKDDKYPAANFEPKIIYSDSNASEQTSAQSAEQFDPKYPAAYFKPKIIYP
jgi:hypothetical protein